MNRNARRFRVDIGMAYLVEVIADVLQEAYNNGDGPLLVEEIKQRSAFRDTPFINQTVRGVLNRMKQDGLVDRQDNQDGFQEWWLIAV